MRQVETILAKKYANAFLNVYGVKITKQDITISEQLSQFLKEHKQYLSLFILALFTPDIKKKLLQAVLIKRARLSRMFDSLITVLVDHNRGDLIGAVLDQLVQIYRERNTICSFNIMSSHPLEEKAIKAIGQFLAVQTGYDIIYTYSTDASLIAGIRLQSDWYLWEYSIRKSLNAMDIQFMHQERYG